MATIARRTYPGFILTQKTDVTIVRSERGFYTEDGIWVEGGDTLLTIEANVQPLQRKDLMLLSESDRTKEWIKLYSVSPMKTADEGFDGNDADIVLWENRRYKAMKSRHWVMGVLDHYEIHAAREPISAGVDDGNQG